MNIAAAQNGTTRVMFSLRILHINPISVAKEWRSQVAGYLMYQAVFSDFFAEDFQAKIKQHLAMRIFLVEDYFPRILND